MKDVMLDFETLGKGPNKLVCQVGACYFDRATGEIGKTFKRNIDPRSHERAGGMMDADTVMWWLKQSEAARTSILTEPLNDVFNVFVDLNNFLSEADRVWSHATFDFVTLITTLNQLSIKPRVSYKAGMDIRTLVYLAGTQVSKHTREGTHHDALEDCKYQVKYVTEALSVVKGKKSLLKTINGLFEE